ncbi:MAG: L,D-transpeptidase family protein [Micromonosporaceae bacterium]
MRRITRMAVCAVVAVTVVALGAATYAFGKEPAAEATFNYATPDTSPSATSDGSGQPSATGEDGGPDPSPSTTGKDASHGCPTGPKQRKVETHLAAIGGFGPVTVDGEQSAEDCAAIKKFQRRYGITPSKGKAGPTTAYVARRLAATKLDTCKPKAKLTVCVDLTHQTMWVVRDGDVVLGPTPVRTGRPGYATPAGHYKITEKKQRTISSYYDVALPYWQRFVGDIGFHQTPSYLHSEPGSHGCVNLLPRDAVALWKLTSVGTKVHSFGRRPGT